MCKNVIVSLLIQAISQQFFCSCFLYPFLVSLVNVQVYSPCSWCSQVDTASEVEELDIDAAPAPYTASRGAAKLQVFIARYR